MIILYSLSLPNCKVEWCVANSYLLGWLANANELYVRCIWLPTRHAAREMQISHIRAMVLLAYASMHERQLGCVKYFYNLQSLPCSRLVFYVQIAETREKPVAPDFFGTSVTAKSTKKFWKKKKQYTI